MDLHRKHNLLPFICMSKGYEDKLEEVKQLLRQKEDIERRLKAIFEPERVAVLPSGFSINNEIFGIVASAGQGGISAQDVLSTMKKKHPTFGIDRKRIASALAYLKNGKKSVEQTGRGIYRTASQNETANANNAGG